MSTLAIPFRKIRRAASSAASAGIPSLETGYHLTQPEFHRRYELMPEVKRSELIEGIVFLSSPLSIEHGKATARVGYWLGGYAAETRGVEMAGECSVILDNDNEYQPDAHLLIAGDLKKISAAVRRGLATADQANFAKKLSAAK